jgi:hypothetical protein
MKTIKPFGEFLNEAVKSKAIDVETEQKNQSTILDSIKVARNKMSKIDADQTKKLFQKTQAKALLTQTIAKLTMSLAQSMNKEYMALQGLAKEQSKQ